MELIILTGILNIVCFLLGAKVTQMVYKNKEIKVVPNPIEKIKEKKEDKEISKEEQRFKDIADNIDAYNGTSIGQKKIGG